MKSTIFTNNSVNLIGRVASVKEYSKDKAANVTIAIDNGRDDKGNARPATFVQTKSFVPAVYNATEKGMLVQVQGHIATSSYEKDGETVYNTDLVADTIVFLEPKSATEARKAKATA